MPTIPFSLIARLIGALALIGLGFGLGYKFEHGAVLKAQEALKSFEASSAMAAQKQAAQNALIVQQHDAITQQIGATYAAQIEKIRRNPDRYGITCRMRQPAHSSSSGMPSTGATSQSVDAASAYSLDAQSLPQQCAETTQQLIDLQDWVNSISK